MSLVVVLFTWPTWAYVPRPGIDQSWQVGLSWAAALGLQWGRDIVFTYGPLGYTLTPMMVPPQQVVMAGLVHMMGAVVTLASFHALLAERRDLSRSRVLVLSLVAAVVVIVVGVGITGGVPGGRASVLTVAAVPLALSVLVLPLRWPIVVSGLLLGVLGHQKLSEAVLAAGLIAICALARARRRDLTLLVALTTGTWVAVWVLLGQDLGALLGYLQGQVGLVSAYVSAMAIEKDGFLWTYVPAMGLVAVLLIQTADATRRWPRGRRALALAAVSWFLWMCVRQGFVRHDVHDVFFFTMTAVMAVALMTLAWRGTIVGLGAAACTLSFIVLVAYGVSISGVLDRRESVAAAARGWTAVTDETARADQWQAARAEVRDDYEITASIIDSMGTRTATVDPWDLAALVATEAVLDPIPTLQLYAAYSPELDELNARSLAEHPRQILRARLWEGSDGRFAYWESPRYQTAVYCGYDLLAETDRWLLLEPAPRDRCGGPHDHQLVRALPGVAIDVPSRPDAITLAFITYERPLLEVLATLVFKGPERHVSYGMGTWRMPYVPHARDLMLNAPVPHPAFRGLPATPWSTMTLDAPALVEFEFVDVMR